MEILFIILVIAVVVGVYSWGRSIEAAERAPEGVASSLTVLHDLGRGRPVRPGSPAEVVRGLMVSLGVARLRDHDGAVEVPRMVAEPRLNGCQRLAVFPLPGTLRLWLDDAVRVELSNVLGIPMNAEVVQEGSGKLVLTWQDGPSATDAVQTFEPEW